MKKFIPSFVILSFAMSVAIAAPRERPQNAMRVGTGVNTVMPAPQQSATSVAIVQPAAQVIVPVTLKDMRADERDACVANNVGIGNTFVWASRRGNTSNYAYMVEDMDAPENNACFVKVELKSKDSRINVGESARYFEMGQNITCGDWADQEKLKKQILDAKKSARTWGTVAGVVGGAGVGVGAMELFGNKLIGGKAEGQKSLTEEQFLYSQMTDAERTNYAAAKTKLTNLCEQLSTAGGKSTDCD